MAPTIKTFISFNQNALFRFVHCPDEFKQVCLFCPTLKQSMTYIKDIIEHGNAHACYRIIKRILHIFRKNYISI